MVRIYNDELTDGAVVILFIAIVDSLDSGCVSGAPYLSIFFIIDNPSDDGTV